MDPSRDRHGGHRPSRSRTAGGRSGYGVDSKEIVDGGTLDSPELRGPNRPRGHPSRSHEISQAVGMRDRGVRFHRELADPSVYTEGLVTRADARPHGGGGDASRSARGCPVMMVTEDTTRAASRTPSRHCTERRSMPEPSRLCLSDTVGHATPEGARARSSDFVMEEIVEHVGGGRRGGLARASRSGIRACELRLPRSRPARRVSMARRWASGERSGNTEMDLLLVNLQLAGSDRQRSDDSLGSYCDLAVRGVRNTAGSLLSGLRERRVSHGHGRARGGDREGGGEGRPVVGRPGLLEYSRPRWWGASRSSRWGRCPGLSNIKYWLGRHGHDPDDRELCERIFQAAKSTDRTLTVGRIWRGSAPGRLNPGWSEGRNRWVPPRRLSGRDGSRSRRRGRARYRGADRLSAHEGGLSGSRQPGSGARGIGRGRVGRFRTSWCWIACLPGVSGDEVLERLKARARPRCPYAGSDADREEGAGRPDRGS